MTHFFAFDFNVMHITRVVSSEISGNLFQSFRKFPEICWRIFFTLYVWL